MKKVIFIVNGKPRAGKDTFAYMLKKHTKVFKYSSIDIIKRIATVCGWNGAKTEKDRKFLSDLKRMTTEYSDLAFNDLKIQVSWFKGDDKKYEVMLIDVREPEEIERACKAFGAKSIFIENINVKDVTTNESDLRVEEYEYDYVIKNNGDLKDFEKEIAKFYEEVIK